MKRLRRWAMVVAFLLFVAVVGVVPTGGVAAAPAKSAQLTGTGINYGCNGSFTLSIHGGKSGVVCSTLDLAHLTGPHDLGLGAGWEAWAFPGHSCFFLDAKKVGDCSNPGSGDPCAGTSNCFGAEFIAWEISFCDLTCEVDRIEFDVDSPSGTGRFSGVTGSLEYSAAPGDQADQISGEIETPASADPGTGGPSPETICEARGGTYEILELPHRFSCTFDGATRVPGGVAKALTRPCEATPGYQLLGFIEPTVFLSCNYLGG